MNKLLANLAKNTQKQLREQREKHAMEIAAMKRANLDTQNLLTTKMTPAQTMNDHRTTSHFNAMTKPSETFFDRTPENWPAFEHRLLTEAENPIISWNQDITNYQPTVETSEPFNFLERYFDLPDSMTNTLINDLADAKIINLVTPASQLYKLHCLKNKLKNCLTTDLAHGIEASMPIGLSNKDGRLFSLNWYHTPSQTRKHT
jgi:exonuclease VII large subunit